MNFDPKTFEKKWRDKWLSEKINKTPEAKLPEIKNENLNPKTENGQWEMGNGKFYSLYSFPYPSGTGLHVGHIEGMVANDIVARFYRLQGYNVTLPMGWDSFGLPAENYAIKTGIPPATTTEELIKAFIIQIDKAGISVDWEKEVGAHRPDYYRWTQWIFTQLFKKGLAYKAKASVNWCPKDQTVLANEQVIDGHCERCDSIVIQKELEQWFFKITDYAERLDKDLEKIDWPEGTKQQQKNWIGKSQGTIVKFQISNGKSEMENGKFIEVFTTRVDTIFSAAFLVIAPEIKIVEELKSHIENFDEVEKYREETKSKTDLERQINKEKTGVQLKGVTAINPANGEAIPVYVSDFVIGTYGTGALFGDAHDDRDFEFATKFNIPITSSILPAEGDIYIGYNAKKWSNDFEKFVIDLESIDAKFIKKTEKDVLFTFKEKDLETFIEFAKKSVAGRKSWHDVVGKEAIIIFGDGEVVKIPKFQNNSEVFNKMKSLEEGVRKFNSLWEMFYNSDYKAIVCNTEDGVLYNSGEFDGLTSNEARIKITKWLENKGFGKLETSYRLRDWLVSRQRYWGCPIPIVYDPEGKPHAIEDQDLPLKLPTDVDFLPHGESPIARSKSFKEDAEKKYGKGWHYEVDTMDTFVDSSWYFFRFCDPKNLEKFADSAKMNYWLPTDLYMIGAEHTVLHLLYSRFFTKFFFDEGIINFDEPFYRMRHMGTILGPDGKKMSKRWGNVINPSDEIEKYGADTLRIYEMFMGPLEEAKPWNDRTENGVFRFLNKVWNLQGKIKDQQPTDSEVKLINKLVDKLGKDIPALSFNTSVAKLMEATNEFTSQESISKEIFAKFLIVLSPFAPYITEELWSILGNNYSIHQQKWPEVDSKYLIDDTITMAVQVNGKVRGTIELSPEASQDEAMKLANSNENIKKHLTFEPKKVIYVKGRILNIIV